MKRLVVLVLVAGLTPIAPFAEAGHAPSEYCSETGDVCASARRVDGRRVLKIRTAARYFRTYEACVTAPDGSRACREGRMRDRNGDDVWTGRMDWANRFPNEGPGAYSVRWRSTGFRSPRLGFHVR